MSEHGWFTANLNEADRTMEQRNFKLDHGQVRATVSTFEMDIQNRMWMMEWALKFQPAPGETNWEYVRAREFNNPIFDALSGVSVFHMSEPEAPFFWSYIGEHGDDVEAIYASSRPNGPAFDASMSTETRYAKPRQPKDGK